MNLLKIFTKSYKLEDVFTPATSANITYIPRQETEKYLNKALHIPGKQIVIYGHSGSGKTTLLMHTLKNNKQPYIICRCTTTSTMDSIIMEAFDYLNPYYIDSKSFQIKRNNNYELSAEYSKIKASIGQSNEFSASSVHRRILPIQLTPQRLAKFIGQANCIWIIEDFHKVADEEKIKISQMMKLFMDESENYPKTKIVILGAADKGNEVVKYDSELNNRITEIEVPLLTVDEIRRLIVKGTSALNVVFCDEIISEISKNSNRLATIAHQLSYNLCYNKKILKTYRRTKSIEFQMSDLQEAIKDFSSEKQDTYKSLFNKITEQRKAQYQNVELILAAICKINKDEVTQHEIFEEIKQIHPNYPQSNLSYYLKALVSPKCEEVLRCNSGRYYFSDPFFKSYIIMRKA